MNNSLSPGRVVVAVDGSSAAIDAAEWAAREALHHDVPLRLVHVVHVRGAANELNNAHSIENEYAETCLLTASSAVKELRLPIQIDTAVLRGEIDSALITESDGAALLCLGSTGIGRLAAAALGSTAATVAQRARCTVAIIRRTRDRPPPETGFIAVILDDQPGSAEAMHWAMEEARVRHAPLLALGTKSRRHLRIDHDEFNRQLHPWLQRYPDVTVEIATTRMNPARYLQGFIGALQLVVIGSNHATQVMELVGPHAMPILTHADCSVLVARDPIRRQITQPHGPALETKGMAL